MHFALVKKMKKIGHDYNMVQHICIIFSMVLKNLEIFKKKTLIFPGWSVKYPRTVSWGLAYLGGNHLTGGSKINVPPSPHPFPGEIIPLASG